MDGIPTSPVEVLRRARVKADAGSVAAKATTKGPYWTTFGLRLSASAEPFTPAVLVSGPALVSLSGDGCGQAAIFHTGTTDVAGLSDPVATASVDVYRTGLTTDAVLLPQVAVGDRMAAVVTMSTVPGSPGVSRVRVRVPSDIAPGSAVPVRLTSLIGRATKSLWASGEKVLPT